jgi:hypothetical protein
MSLEAPKLVYLPWLGLTAPNSYFLCDTKVAGAESDAEESS